MSKIYTHMKVAVVPVQRRRAERGVRGQDLRSRRPGRECVAGHVERQTGGWSVH